MTWCMCHFCVTYAGYRRRYPALTFSIYQIVKNLVETFKLVVVPAAVKIKKGSLQLKGSLQTKKDYKKSLVIK